MEGPTGVTVSNVFSGMQEVFTLLLTMFEMLIRYDHWQPAALRPCSACNPWYACDVRNRRCPSSWH